MFGNELGNASSFLCQPESPILSFPHLYLKSSSPKEAETLLQKPSCAPFRILERFQNCGGLAVPHTLFLHLATAPFHDHIPQHSSTIYNKEKLHGEGAQVNKSSKCFQNSTTEDNSLIREFRTPCACQLVQVAHQTLCSTSCHFV